MTRRGKPVAALMPVDVHTDLENLVVTTHPKFRAIIEQSDARYRAEGGLSTAEVRARLDQGATVRAEREGRLGLASMAQRAEAIGARLLLVGRASGGTQVRLEWGPG